jgi:hypothetical protein
MFINKIIHHTIHIKFNQTNLIKLEFNLLTFNKDNNHNNIMIIKMKKSQPKDMKINIKCKAKN